MRLLHTSDWHLGKRLDLFSRIEEQRQVLEEILQLADEHNVDAVLISGDLFDSFNPSIEAQELFYAALKRLSSNGARPVIAIAGNHDSADAIQAPEPLARLHGIILLGYITTSSPPVTTDSGVTISFPAPGAVRVEFGNKNKGETPDKEKREEESREKESRTKAGRTNSPRLNILASPYANQKRFQYALKQLGFYRQEGIPDQTEKQPPTEAEFVSSVSELWSETANALFSPNDINVCTAHLYAVDTTVGSNISNISKIKNNTGKIEKKEQLPLGLDESDEIEEIEEIEEPGSAPNGAEYRAPYSLPEPEDEKPILYKGGLPPIPASAFPENTQYVALGHLHRSQVISEMPVPVAYCGSPLSYSRSETNQQKYVFIVDIEPGEHARISSIPLETGIPILRPTCESVEAALQWLTGHQDAYVELTLKLETYLSSEDRRRIYATHERILSIIPEVEGAEPLGGEKIADINQSIETLFSEYYASTHQGAEPSGELLELFKEVLHTAGEEP